MRELDPSRRVDHIDRLHASAWGLCGNRQWAEDLVEETYARALARPRLFRTEDDLVYLLRVLRGTFVGQLKNERRRPRAEAVASGGEPVDAAGRMNREPEAETRAVYGAIAQLPEDFRFALVAVDVAGLSHEQAAKALRIRVGTVRSRLFRARDRVADLLAE